MAIRRGLTLLSILLSLITGAGCDNGTRAGRAIEYINPFIGTAGDHGQLYPGVSLPFGMVKLSPDTYPDGLNGAAHTGYNYRNSRIMGFSHLRICGTGCFGAGGNILIKPGVGVRRLDPENYSSRYDKVSENASAGYYCVFFPDEHIRAELTATLHAGLHRYTFPASDSAFILFDLGRGFTRVADAYLEISAPNEVRGMVIAEHICMASDFYTLYFTAQFSKPFRAYDIFGDGKFESGISRIAGKNIGAFFDFDTRDGEEILVRLGISPVGFEESRRDLESEIPAWNFSRVRESAEKEWDDILGRITVEGAEENKILFNTMLYRSHMLPVDATGASGTYRGTDGLVHMAENFVYYDSYTTWDTYRTKYPLFSLTVPEKLVDITRSLSLMYGQGMKCRPFPSVRMEHTIPILLDAFSKGLHGFEPVETLAGMVEDAMQLMPRERDETGYIPGQPDLTLECSYDAWCVARMAQLLGKAGLAARFFRRAEYYRNTWDPAIGFPRARAKSGEWLPFPDPAVVDERYVYEGSMWQWRWFVPHDVPALIELLGGREKFIEALDYFFSNDLYNHGNQPDLHAAYLFACAGAPWLTQKYVKKILCEPMVQRYGTHGFFKSPVNGRIYRNAPEGFLREMDDDGGTMSAWYVLSAIGLFPVCVGEPVYMISAPLFDRVEINLSNHKSGAKSFTINARNVSDKNYYIQSASLNGNPLNQTWIPHSAIVRGGTLTLEMGSKPNKEWGASPSAAPPPFREE